MVSRSTNAPVKATPANLLQNFLREVRSFLALTTAFSLDPISVTLFLSCCPYRMTARTNLQALASHRFYKGVQSRHDAKGVAASLASRKQVLGEKEGGPHRTHEGDDSRNFALHAFGQERRGRAGGTKGHRDSHSPAHVPLHHTETDTGREVAACVRWTSRTCTIMKRAASPPAVVP